MAGRHRRAPAGGVQRGGDMKIRLLLAGQDPSLPGGMAKYVGGLSAYLEGVPEVETHFFNETRVKGRTGLASANLGTAARESGTVLLAFQRSLRRLRPNVVHLQMAHGLSVMEKCLMASLAARRGIPALVHVHAAGLDTLLAAMPAWRLRWLDRALSPPNRVVVLSEGMAHLFGQHLPRVQVSVIPNAVALVTPPPLKSPATFGFLGHMDGRKGECDLIRAMTGPNAPTGSLWLAGDGPGRRAAETLAHGKKEIIRFLGNVDGAAKASFFREIDVLCLPSQAENLPIALLEAMGHGRPVIATPVGAIPEMITDGLQGWLTPAGDVPALAAAMADAARRPEEVERRGRAAWQTVAERYTWERNGPHVVQLYRIMKADGEYANS